MTRVLRAFLVIACMLATALAVPATARADDGDISLSVLRVSATEVHVGVCLSDAAVSTLPFNPVIQYSVTGPAGAVASATWSYEDPEAAVVNTNACPAEFVSFAITCLNPGTDYTFAATATLTPRLKDDLGVVDTERAVRTASASVSATTRGSAGPGGCPADDSGGSGDSGAAGPEPAPDAVTVTPSSGTTSDASTGAGTEVQPVIIARPQEFGPAQLAALSPEQIAMIDPATFGQLPPSAFTALKPDQAAALTPAQASAIRPARAASLSPATVRSIPVDAVKVLRPAAVKFLSPAAVGAMTTAQLRALTPRQIAALRPKQLAALTAAERALLRR